MMDSLREIRFDDFNCAKVAMPISKPREVFLRETKTAPPENPMALYNNQRSNDCDIARSVSGLLNE